MPEPIVPEVDTELADIQAKSGINEGLDTDIDLNNPPEEKPAETKTEDKPEEDKSKDKEKPAETTDKKVAKEEIVTPPKPAKSDRPLKAVFTQLGELRQSIASILEKISATPAEKKETTVIIDDAIKTIAEKQGLDPQGLSEIAAVLQKSILKQLESTGVLKKDLSDDLKEKLKALDTLQASQKAQAEVAQFNTEWGTLLPELSKQFPNAGANELKAARDLMDKLSHDPKTGGVITDEAKKIMKGYPLDYILYQNRKAFEAILKLAKSTKAGETVSKKIVPDEETKLDADGNPDDDIDLDPERMTPEKMKAYQKKKYGL